MKLSVLYLITCILFCSCLNEKHLFRNQVIFKVPQSTLSTTTIDAYSNNNTKMQVVIEESNSTLTIKKAPTETNNFTRKSTVQSNFTPQNNYAQLELSGKFYFPETTFPKQDFPSQSDRNGDSTFKTPASLKYSENKLVLQTLTIPLKIRPKISNDRYKDSLPSQVETGFNAGFAFGLKRTWNIFKPELNLLGQNTTKYSLSTGILFNVGGADVKKSTTNYSIVVDRKEPYYSYGLFFLLGFNNINIGYSIGGDHLFSNSRHKWVYEGRLWHGITLALDILK